MHTESGFFMSQNMHIVEWIACIDLTSLNDNEDEKSIAALVAKANRSFASTSVAAVCVFDRFGQQVRSQLNPAIRTAVVGPEFPLGVATESDRLNFYQTVAKSEIEEVDIVVNPQLALNDNWDEYLQTVETARKNLPDKTLKVILETGLLQQDDLIQKAAKTAIDGGADFIKTSTGKTNVGYTPEALALICDVVSSHFKRTGKRIGIKVSGGVRSLNQLIEIESILKNNSIRDWLQPNTFRIGASALYDNLIQQ